MAYVNISPLVEVDPDLPIAGFDLDHTLIKPIKNKVFPKDRDDWKFVDDQIVPKLFELSDNYRIIIFTNQGEKRFNEDDFTYKIRNIQKSLPFIEVRISYGKDKYRKPETGMWPKKTPSGSFYVGDAAGRPGNAVGRPGNAVGRPADFSNSDLLFAKNVGVKFYTPEEFFKGELDESEPDETEITFNYPMLPSQHIICLMGYQASGKSTFAKSLVDEYDIAWVGNDEKDKKKVIRQLKSFLEKGKTVIIDRTNPSLSDREEWVTIASDFHIPIRLVHFTSTKDKAKLRNKSREKVVPTIAFNLYGSKYVEPDIDEGFHDIKRFEIPDL